MVLIDGEPPKYDIYCEDCNRKLGTFEDFQKHRLTNHKNFKLLPQ